MRQQPGSQLRELLSGSHGMLVVPGAYDCITARAIERAGFKAAYMTGAATAAAHGFPDYGLLTMTEMVANAGRMAASLGIPLIADADTGYGNELNVTRAVREYEAAGVAGIHIEDQDYPKRCGHLDGKSVVEVEAFVSKIRAALEARRSPDFIIIARTDARSVTGLDEAILRANAALAAGADMAFVEAPETMEEIAQVPRRVNGPCMLNIVWRGRSPEISFSEAERMGYRLAILPSLQYKALLGAANAILDETLRQGRHPVPTGNIDIVQGVKLAGGDAWDRIRMKYSA